MKRDSSVTDYMNALAVRARAAVRPMASATAAQKNAALIAAARLIRERIIDILDVNAAEVSAAKISGEEQAFLDRMTLNSDRVAAIIESLENIADLADPVGTSIRKWARPNGLEIERIRTPIGVIAMIYESRPNVTIDAAAIAIKAGNAIILRGGTECVKTNKALFECFHTALVLAGLPGDAAQFVETTDRSAVGAILSGLGGRIDLVIPRGGKSLVARVQAEARAPVLSHLDGICHVYVDRDADIDKAVAIIVNSKMRRTGVCGAAETLLIDAAIAAKAWPVIAKALREEGCELRGDEALRRLDPEVFPASDEDFDTEYLAAILSVAIVDGVSEAITHIAKHGSAHTESIVTENADTAARFLSEVDSAIVMHNASTQFADGGEFGMGAEIGIATGRLHARGPVGVEELMTYKNVIRGSGQVRP